MDIVVFFVHVASCSRLYLLSVIDILTVVGLIVSILTKSLKEKPIEISL